MDKKEILDEIDEREQKIKSRIDSLYGIKEMEQPVRKKTKITAEEKRDIRKRMVLLIWFCVIMSILIIMNILNPITKIFEKEKTVTEQKEALSDLPSGDVALTNKEIQTMIGMFSFDVNNPLYETNIIKLFEGNKEFSQMDFELQMFLLTSNSTFNEYLYKNTKLKSYNPGAEQNLNITIKTEDLNKIIQEIIEQDIEINYQNFKYYYDFGEKGIQYFDVILTEGIYTFTPIEPIAKSNVEAYLKPVSASNIDNEIYIRSSVLFVKDNCIYGNQNMDVCLDANLTLLDNYYFKGSAIEFEFKRVVDMVDNKIDYKLIGITIMTMN